MSNYLRFQPTQESSYYFVSYNNEDADRVGAIASLLSARLPLWYDLGIPYGDKWEAVISEKIYHSKAVLLFFTRGILYKEDSWVAKEFRIAKRIPKRIYVIMMDQITDQEIPYTKLSFWDDINNLQNVNVFERQTAEQIVKMICKAITDTESTLTSEDPPVPPQPQGLSAAAAGTGAAAPEITEDMLEPSVEIHIVELAPKKRGFRKGPDKAALLQIRQENKVQLTEVRDRLQNITDQRPADAVKAYRSAREAMILVTQQLGAYDLDYKITRKIEDFEDAYERNLLEIRQSILSGKRTLSARGTVLTGQILYGLNAIIELL